MRAGDAGDRGETVGGAGVGRSGMESGGSRATRGEAQGPCSPAGEGGTCEGSPEPGRGGGGALGYCRGCEEWEELAPGRLKPAQGQGSRVGTDSHLTRWEWWLRRAGS